VQCQCQAINIQLAFGSINDFITQPGGPVAAAGLSVNCGKLSLACLGSTNKKERTTARTSSKGFYDISSCR